MAIRCGRCGNGIYHESTADVRACFNGAKVKRISFNAARGNYTERGRSIPVDGQQEAKPFTRPTEKQISYLEKLLKKRNLVLVQGIQNVSKSQASSLLTDLTEGVDASDARFRRAEVPAGHAKIPGLDITVPVEQEELEIADGFYVFEDEVYKVVHAKAQGSGKPYAKRLDKETGEWVYKPGDIKKLRPEYRMNLEQAIEVAKVVATDVDGRLYGRCFICGQTLTLEESINRMMGSTCATKHFGA